MAGHIHPPHHLELLPGLAVPALHHEAVRKDVRQFGAIPVPPPHHLLLIVVVVAAGEQVPEDQLRHVDPLLLVYLDGYALAIVVDADVPLAGVDLHPQRVHLAVPLVIVRGVDEHLVEDLVECGDVGDLLAGESESIFSEDPLGGLLHLYAADVGVRTQQDVLEGSLLLIGLLDGLFPHDQISLNYSIGSD